MVEQTPEDLGWLNGSRAGRAVLSAMLTLLLFTLVIWNLPQSEIRGQIRPSLRVPVRAIGLDQSWGVFAPNPTRISIAVEADVTMADGSTEHYTFPHGDDFVGAYREYRWRKWERRVRLDENRRMWEPAARWVGARYADRDPVLVVLTRTFSDTPEPGSGAERTWQTVEFYELELTTELGEAQ